MKRTFKGLFSAFLAIMLAFSVTLVGLPVAAEEVEYPVLELGESISIELGKKETVRYVITPSKNGECTIYTDSEYDTAGELFDSWLTTLAEQDDIDPDNDNYNFSISSSLTKDETYYFDITNNEKSAISVTLYSEFTSTDNGPESFSLSSESLTMYEGKTDYLSVVDVYPEDADTGVITWSSSDENVVTVDEYGCVTAVSAGTAIVTAEAENSVSATCEITVNALYKLSVGEEQKITIESKEKTPYLEFTPEETAKYRIYVISDSIVTFSLNDYDNGISISEYGTRTDPGVDVITPYLYAGAVCSLDVSLESGSGTYTIGIEKLVAPEWIEIEGDGSVSGYVGETHQLTLNIHPEDATYEGIKWSSDDEAVVTVDENGLLSFVGKGEAYVEVYVDDCCTGVNVYVEEFIVTELLEDTDVTVEITAEQDVIIYEFVPKTSGIYVFTSEQQGDGDPKAVLYDSYMEELISGDDEGGNMNFRIEYQLEANDKYYLMAASYRTAETYTLRAERAAQVESFEISVNNIYVFEGDSTELYLNKITPTNAAGSFTWTVNDESLATIEKENESQATFKALKAGTVTVTATADSGVSQRVNITVMPVYSITEDTAVKAEITDEVISIGGKVRYTFTAPETARYEFYAQNAENGTGAEIILRDSEFSWINSSNIYYADENGVFAFQYDLIKGQTYYIDAYAYNATSFDVAFTKTVAPTAIEINDGAESVIGYVGTVETLFAEFLNDHADDNTDVSWSSSDEKIATVDDYGNVTFISEGEAVITAAVSDKVSDTVKVISTEAPTLTLGKSEAVTAEDDDATVTYKFVPEADARYSFVIDDISGGTNFEISFINNGESFDGCYNWSDGEAFDYQVNFTRDEAYYITFKTTYAVSYSITVYKTVAPQEIIINHGDELLVGSLNNSDYLRVDYNPIYTDNSNSVTWSSADSSIVSVDEWGNITFAGLGETTVTATIGDISDSIKIFVTDNPILTVDSYIRFSLTKDTVQECVFSPDETARYAFLVYPYSYAVNYTAELYDESGTLVASENYYSEDESFFTFQYEAVAGEKYTFKITSDTDSGAEIGVRKTVAPDSIQINDDDYQVAAFEGSQIELELNMYPNYSYSSEIVWSVSDETYATVDKHGVVTVLKAGEFTVTATCGEVSDSIVVVAGSVTDLKIGSQATTVIKNPDERVFYRIVPEADGEYVFYSNTEFDTYGTLWNAELSTQLEWNDDSGEYSNFKISYEMKAGETYYLETRFLGSDMTGDFEVCAMEAVNITEIQINSSDIFTCYPDENHGLGVTILPINAKNETLTWTSSDENVVAITNVWENGSASVDTLSAGTAVITVTTESGATDSITFVVKEIKKLTLDTEETVSIESYGESHRYEFTAPKTGRYELFTTGASIPVYINLHTENDSYYASDYENKNVVLQCDMQEGATYDITVGLNWYSYTDEFTMCIAEAVEPESVTINGDAETVYGYVGAQLQLETEYTPAHANNSLVIWSSSDETVATVGDDGAVTVLKEGTAIITARISDAIFDTIVLNASKIPEMPLNEEVSVAIKENNGFTYYSFTPETDSTYVLTFDADQHLQVGFMYSYFDYFTSHYGNWGEITVELTGGETYYIAFKNNSNKSSGTATVTLNKVQTIKNVEILQYPEKMDYYEISGFNYDGLKLRITFEDGHTADWSYGDEENVEGHSISFGWNGTETEYYHSIVYVGAYQVTFEFNILESPVADIVINSGEIGAFIENYNGYWSGDIYYYYLHSKLNECTFKVIYTDGSEQVLDIYDSIDGYSLGYSQNSEWTVGGENYINLTFMGKTVQLPVEVIKNPVKSIELYSDPIELIEEYDGYWNGENVFMYEYWPHTDKLVLKINYTDGSSKIVPYGNGYIDGYYVSLDTDQYSNPWSVGENYITAEYLGITAQLPVIVVENPVESITVISDPTKEYIFGDVFTGSLYDDEYYPWVEDLTGLSFTVKYTDGTTAAYTWEDAFIDEYNSYYWDDILGYVIVNESLTSAGTYDFEFSYYGRMDTVTVKINPSPVSKIEVIKDPDITYIENGYLPDFIGMQLRVTYTDNTTETVTVTEDNIEYEIYTYGGYAALVDIGGSVAKITEWSTEEDGDGVRIVYLGAVEYYYGFEFEGYSEKVIKISNITATGDGLTVVVDGEEIVFENPVYRGNIDEDYGYATGYVKTEKGLMSYGIEFSLDGNGYFENAIVFVRNNDAYIEITSGDVNGDGSTDVRDLVAMKKITAKAAEAKNKTNGDMNLDGGIDSLDLALIKKYLLGKPANA